MKPLNVAVVGCGAIAAVHLAIIKQIPGIKLYAVCEIIAERGEEIAKTYGCKYYSDFDLLLADEAVACVHVCTPHYLHFPMIAACLKAGKHVFSEKPLGMNEAECEMLRVLAANSTSKAGICLQNRLNPTSVRLKELVDTGVYGALLGMRAMVTWCRDEAYYTQSPWRGKQQYEGGGLLMNQMIHTLDLMQWIGGNIAHIEGHVANRCHKGIIDVEDTAEATLWFENDIVGNFYGTNSYSTNASVFLEVHLEKAILRIEDQELIRKDQEGTTCLVTDVTPSVGKQYWGNAHETIIHQFYDAVLNDTTDYIPLSEGVCSVGICQQIYGACEKDKREVQ